MTFSNSLWAGKQFGFSRSLSSLISAPFYRTSPYSHHPIAGTGSRGTAPTSVSVFISSVSTKTKIIHHQIPKCRSFGVLYPDSESFSLFDLRQVTQPL